jgi:NADPH:quinone reductase
MRAIVIRNHGGPEVLTIEDRPDPAPERGAVVIDVKAFGLNQAEVYFRKGAWGNVAEISGIECVGVIRSDGEGRFKQGQKVMALVGGMGRSRNGSYAEQVSVPYTNVIAIESDLPWEALAAIPESYATAWAASVGILRVSKGQTVLVRGATSALGQAVVNIAAQLDAHVIVTSRNPKNEGAMKALGAHAFLVDAANLSVQVLQQYPGGIDAVLDIVGNSTCLDSLAMVKRGGGVCAVGFLGGSDPLILQPIFQIPSGVYLSAFASAMALGTSAFPLSGIPFQNIVDRVSDGSYKAQPARVFAFEDIQNAHRLIESGEACGKIVVLL